MKAEYRSASSSSQVELELASQVLNALKYTSVALLQIKLTISTEPLCSLDATALETNNSGIYTFPMPQIHCKLTANPPQSISNNRSRVPRLLFVDNTKGRFQRKHCILMEA